MIRGGGPADRNPRTARQGADRGQPLPSAEPVAVFE